MGCCFFCIFDATCVGFACASATACRFFLHVRLGFVHSFSSFSLSFIHMFVDANCVIFSSASATTSCGFFSANCTGLIATSATGTSTTGNGYTAASQQADNSDSSKDLFQFLCVHGLFLLNVEYVLFLMKRSRWNQSKPAKPDTYPKQIIVNNKNEK